MNLSENNFELLRSELGMTNREFAKLIGINEANYTRLKQGTLPVGEKTLRKIREAFPEENIDWILKNTGSRKSKQATKIITKGQLTNAIELGVIPEDDEENTKFKEISPGHYRMTVPLVPEFAKAGYLTGFSDKVYMDELPKHEATVKFYHRGKYIAFEISGDSMFDGTIDSVPDGCTVVAREIKRELWTSKFHTHRYPNYIFVHKTEGILCKQIANQDLSTGKVVLRSLNPDKDLYPDFEVYLDDISQVLNVVKRELDY